MRARIIPATFNNSTLASILTFKDLDSGFFENGTALAAHNRIRIGMREVDFLDAGIDDSLCAGGRAAIMAARFQRYIDGRPAGEFARVTQRHDLGMSIPRALCTPLTDDDAIANDDGTHGRIRSTDSDREEGIFKGEVKVVHYFCGKAR